MEISIILKKKLSLDNYRAFSINFHIYVLLLHLNFRVNIY